MRSRVLRVLAAEAVVVVGGLWVIGHHGLPHVASPMRVGGYVTGLLVLALLPPLHLELRRHACWVTLTEVGLIVGWFAVGPWAVVAAATVTESIATVRHRQPALKSAFNFIHTVCGVVFATAVFTFLAQSDALSPVAWAAATAALASCAVFDTLVTSRVLAASEGRPYGSVLDDVVPPATVAFLATCSLGLAGVILLHHSPLTLGLLVPIIGILVLGTRGVAAQRAERVRFERLYAASSRLARLISLPDTLAAIATEAREMVTGSAAICCAIDPAGAWTGMVVDDQGAVPASQQAVEAIKALAAEGGCHELSFVSLPRGSRQALPAANHVVCAAPAADRDGKLVLAVFREIPQDDQGDRRTEVIRAFASHATTVVANVLLYEEVQEALRRQVDLNRQKDDFVATVSHELRTPLTSMIGSIQTVRRLGDRLQPQQRVHLMDMGLTQGERLKRLIDDLLIVAAADQQAVRCDSTPVDMPAILAEVAQEFASVAGERVRLEVAADVGVILTDAEKVRRIMVNLVENAVKYAPGGPIDVHAELSRDQLVLSVTDHGEGIPVEHRERIFERFVQLDQSATRREGGTGLGLHLCRELARVLGGRLTVANAPGGGARFTLVLPAEKAPVEAPGPSVTVHGGDARARPAVAQRPAGITARPAAAVAQRPAGITARPAAAVAQRPASVVARPAGIAVRPTDLAGSHPRSSNPQ